MVDSTVLRRSLTFALQVLQLDANVVLCLNMADEADASGLRLDVKALEAQLGFDLFSHTIGVPPNSSVILAMSP